jgi:hypothetical protein
MITQALYDKMMYFVNLRRFTPQDAQEMEAAIRLLFNPGYTLCTHCRAQIEHGQLMIKNWLSDKTIAESVELMVDTEEPLFDMPTPETIVDEIEADKVGCQKCKRKKQNKG